MVAATERADLARCLVQFDSQNGSIRYLVEDVGAMSLAALVPMEPLRHRALDLVQNLIAVREQVVDSDIRAPRADAAADVEPDGVRYDLAFRREDTADGHPEPDVRIGHERHVSVCEGESCEVARLSEGLFVRQFAPHQDGDAFAFQASHRCGPLCHALAVLCAYRWGRHARSANISFPRTEPARYAALGA